MDEIRKLVDAETIDPLEKELHSHDTALHHAVHENHVEVLRLLLEKTAMHPDSPNHLQRTPLHLAALYGYVELTKTLIKFSARLECKDKIGKTPFMYAMAFKNNDAAIALVEAGAEIGVENTKIQGMFSTAIERGTIKAVQMLMDRGADLYDKNESGELPVQLRIGWRMRK